MFWLQGGKMEDNLKHYKERNEYVDIILKEILQYGHSRRIILSCFDPDLCTMYVSPTTAHTHNFHTQEMMEK